MTEENTTKEDLDVGSIANDVIEENENDQNQKASQQNDQRASNDQNQQVSQQKEDAKEKTTEVPEELLGSKEDQSGKSDEFDESEYMTEQNQVNWPKARDKIKALEQEKKELASKTGDGKQAEELQEKLDSAYDQLAKVDLSSDPRFQQKYQAKEKAITDRLSQAMSDFEVENPEEAIKKAKGMNFKDRHEFLAELSDDGIVTFEQIFNELSSVEGQKQQEIENHSETTKQLDAEGLQQMEKDKKVLQNQTVTELNNSGFFPFKHVDGADDWNKGVDQLKTRHLEILGSSDPSEQSKVMAKGVAADTLLQLYLNERKARTDAEQKLGIKKKVGTNFSGGSDTGTKSLPSTMTAEEAAKRATSEM